LESARSDDTVLDRVGGTSTDCDGTGELHDGGSDGSLRHCQRLGGDGSREGVGDIVLFARRRVSKRLSDIGRRWECGGWSGEEKKGEVNEQLQC
jgi:hypothetical protein